jgi:N-acetylglutamate synthase
MLRALAPAPCFASVVCQNATAACGLGVLQDGFVGLFDIVTDAAVRRQGYGQRLVQSILAWGSRRGAHTANLQVMLNNEPAFHLYVKLGFAEQYRYWHRIRS